MDVCVRIFVKCMVAFNVLFSYFKQFDVGPHLIRNFYHSILQCQDTKHIYLYHENNFIKEQKKKKKEKEKKRKRE